MVSYKVGFNVFFCCSPAARPTTHKEYMPIRTDEHLMKTSVRFLWIAAGIIAMSLTFATAGLGFGEHLCDPTNCRKCHATIYEEFTSTGAHANITCGDCY